MNWNIYAATWVVEFQYCTIYFGLGIVERGRVERDWQKRITQQTFSVNVQRLTTFSLVVFVCCRHDEIKFYIFKGLFIYWHRYAIGIKTRVKVCEFEKKCIHCVKQHSSSNIWMTLTVYSFPFKCKLLYIYSQQILHLKVYL